MGGAQKFAANRQAQYVIAAVVILGAAHTGVRLLRDRPWDRELKAQREAAELDQKIAAQRAREAEQDAKRRAALEAEEAKARALEEEDRAAKEPERNRLAALTAEAEVMSPAQRAAKVHELCPLGACKQEDALAVARAGKTPAERAALERPVEAARADIEVKLRELFARKYAETMQAKAGARGIDPGSFRAEGPQKTTFKASGWFCTDAFANELHKGEISKALKSAGFRRVVCEGPDHVWSGPL